MASPEIEEFGKILVQQIRDMAIRSADMTLLRGGDAMAKRWKKTAREGNIEAFGSVLIPDIVDETIFYMLRAIEEGFLQMTYSTSKGKVVDLTKEGAGELAGWYVGPESWPKLYSRERWVDYSAGIDIDLGGNSKNSDKVE